MTDDYYERVLGGGSQPEQEPERQPVPGPGAVDRPKRRVFGFRIAEQDASRLTDLARELGTSKDALMRGLVPAILEAVEQGRLQLEATEEVEKGLTADGLTRAWVTRAVKWKWADKGKSRGQAT